MDERVLMPPVIDLLPLLALLNNRGMINGSLTCKMAVRILGEVEPTSRSLLDESVKFYRAGIFWLEFLKRDELLNKCAAIRNINDKLNVEQYINSLPDVCIPVGCVVVALDKNNLPMERDILVSGRVGIGTDNSLIIHKFKNINKTFYAIPCTFEPLSICAKTKEQKVLYTNILSDQRMAVTIKYLADKEHLSSIVQSGINKFEPGSCERLTETQNARWTIDNITFLRKDFEILELAAVGSVISMVDNSDMNGSVESFTVPAESKTVNTEQNFMTIEITQENNDDKGVFVKDGRVYYNRKEFYENKEFISKLRGIIDASKAKVGVKLEQLSEFIISDEVWDKYLSVVDDEIEDVVDRNTIDGVYVYSEIARAKLNKFWDKFTSECRTTSKNWKSKAIYTINGKSLTGYTGRALLKQVLNCAYKWKLLEPDESKNGYEETVSDEIDYYINYTSISTVFALRGKGDETSGLITKLQSSLKFYPDCWNMLLVCSVMDISYNFKKCLTPDTDEYFEDFMGWLCRNPYDLIFPLSDISLKDLDKLAMVMGVFCDSSVKDSRCVAYLHGAMTSESNKFVNCRTCVPMQGIHKWFTYGFNCSEMDERRKPSDDVAVNTTVFINAITYLGLPEGNMKIKYTSKQQMTNGVLYTMDVDTNYAIQVYKDSGYGIEVEFDGLPVCLCDYSLLGLEYSIYTRCLMLYNSGRLNEDEELTDEAIDMYIAKFEASKAKELGIPAFTLEAKQREAAHMITSPVMALYGGAGTGKTTTAEVLLYILQEGYGISDDEILFIAPTGRAATRLREVVKRPTSTIHRALKLGIGRKAKVSWSLNDYRVVIVDENSMITVELMAALLKAISDGTRVYFLGDIAQLLPIGFGKPFANMLRFLPCVTLEVSKRAKAGSKITECANAWLSSEVETPIQQGDDLKCVPATSTLAGDITVDICKHYLNPAVPLPQGVGEIRIANLTPDDIQVCSPMKKAGMSYGTSNLNPILRDMFNPFKGQMKVYWKGYKGEVGEFRVGDRVIHTQNMADRERYLCVNGEYQLLPDTQGVMNGDIGKIIDICPYDKINIVDSDGVERKPKRNDKYKIALVVEYLDVDLTTNTPLNYCIIYQLAVDDSVDDVVGCCYATSLSVANTTLELAYALTVHKLQGSQAKLILFPFFSMGSENDFMCNNLVYTGMTRGRSGLYMIGDVSDAYKLKQIQNNRVLGRRLSLFDVY